MAGGEDACILREEFGSPFGSHVGVWSGGEVARKGLEMERGGRFELPLSVWKTDVLPLTLPPPGGVLCEESRPRRGPALALHGGDAFACGAKRNEMGVLCGSGAAAVKFILRRCEGLRCGWRSRRPERLEPTPYPLPKFGQYFLAILVVRAWRRDGSHESRWPAVGQVADTLRCSGFTIPGRSGWLRAQRGC